MKQKTILLILTFLVSCVVLRAQTYNERLARIRHGLDSLATVDARFGTLVDVSVTSFPVSDLLKSLATGNGLNVNLSMERIRGMVTCNLEQVPIKDVLLLCCRENKLDMVIESGIVSIFPYVEKQAPPAPKPERTPVVEEDVRRDGGRHCVRVFPMQYRTVDSILEVIPERLRKDLEIKVFSDQNSLVLSGPTRSVGLLEAYLTEIDKSVPMVSIDVIIVDATDRTSRSTGVKFGKGTEPSGESYGKFSPGIDVSLGATQINRLIDAFNGIGLVNLGKVGPNFYAGLKLLEEDGTITLRSTPKLSTLNGHKATLTSGEIKYYKESQVNIIGTQNPMQSESYLWKNVEASFTLDLLPYVSADSTITIHVNLQQDEFTERDGGELSAPPGKTKRGFDSIVKVHDGEMVLLGGIERNLQDDNSSGVPFIAKVPVLKHIFGSTSYTKENRRLNVFIRPVVIQ